MTALWTGNRNECRTQSCIHILYGALSLADDEIEVLVDTFSDMWEDTMASRGEDVGDRAARLRTLYDPALNLSW